MDAELNSHDENIRKIEDVIDIQKAKGTYNIRQVAFALPSDSESTVSANLAKSLETGLSNSNSNSYSKKLKKFKAKHHKSPTPDVISWPSDSDITVLRLKLCDGSDLKTKVGNLIPGDGLHQPDSSSMVNLATLMLRSQPPSKHTAPEEYLMPLTSWEEHKNTQTTSPVLTEQPCNEDTVQFKQESNVFEAVCSHKENENTCDRLRFEGSGTCSLEPKKCKIARFLRLYFCPCCTFLYKMEKMAPSEISKQTYSQY